jgi:hypothetical protein
LWATVTVCFTRSRRKRAAREEDFAAVPAMSSTQHHYSNGAPSTVGSSGPLVHDTTGVNQSYAGSPINENYVDPNATHTTYVDQSGGMDASNNGHFWQRKSTTAI